MEAKVLVTVALLPTSPGLPVSLPGENTHLEPQPRSLDQPEFNTHPGPTTASVAFVTLDNAPAALQLAEGRAFGCVSSLVF